MRYEKFRIKNFKGIKDTVVDLRSATGANVFALVGLNESGKTTILEAIRSFSPDYRTSTLRKDKIKVPMSAAKERVPRHLIASFTGEITVEATVSLTHEDKKEVRREIFRNIECKDIEGDIPEIITLTRSDIFSRGDYIKTKRNVDFSIKIKRKNDRNFKDLTDDELSKLYQVIYNETPDIAYHDSFIFEFPKRIYLTERAGVSDWVFRQMFEDVLAAGKVSYTLEDIRKRIRNEKYKKSWMEAFASWSQQDDKARIQQIVDQASRTITEAVLGKWNKIFKEDVGSKEISVQFDIEQGQKLSDDKKTYVECDDHDLWISLELKDGTRRFPIQDRSLGFRWFFAFLLFTQFRTKRRGDRPVLFLFDEPAANLHSAAQERLIESFPEIANEDNMLIYSTHSHYMISPDWLEQTFIVTNSSDAPSKSLVESAVAEDESLDITAELYRKFANNHPSDTSYFQPILDRIDVIPSKFDISLPSIILEGKSDFYILRYASLLLQSDELRLIPGVGSGTFDALISIGASWGTNFLFLLDSDNAGAKERARYALESGAREVALCTLSDFDPELREIEDLLDQEARNIISGCLGAARLNKKQILRFFQEQLAKREVIPLGSSFEARCTRLFEALRKRLANLSST
jgi:predicted ATP-dependent endonuclease of OLD family